MDKEPLLRFHEWFAKYRYNYNTVIEVPQLKLDTSMYSTTRLEFCMQQVSLLTPDKFTQALADYDKYLTDEGVM